MNWLSFKKITLLMFTLMLLGNVFVTNIQTFDINSERCEIESLHTNPCVITYVENVAFEIEQDTDIVVSHIDMSIIDFEFISLVQEKITPQKTDFFRYYAKDLSPPTVIELPRSHMVFS